MIGTGSFGVVYEAFDTVRNRDVVLKTLSRADGDSISRFKREFRSLAELRHPNLASLYESRPRRGMGAVDGARAQTGALNEHLSDAFGIMVKQ